MAAAATFTTTATTTITPSALTHMLLPARTTDAFTTSV
jgi:hypothetical protein